MRFQENAWCNEEVMQYWVRHCWKPACEGRMHLVMDIHRAQKTDQILTQLEEDCHTDVTYVPGLLFYSRFLSYNTTH